MYVFVSVGELTGPVKQVALGQVEESAMMREILDRCMDRIESHLPEQDRANARHFWHNEKFVPFNLRHLRDIASSVNVTLELLPDHYFVALPSRAAERYAINPEKSVGQIIDQLMQQKGASRCYNLVPLGAKALAADQSLYDQGILPYHSRLNQQGTELAIHRKPEVALWSIGIVAFAIVLGLMVGYLFARFAP